MFEVIAEKYNGFGDFIQITIRKDNQEMILGAEDSNMLSDVLRGKRGVWGQTKKGEYQPDKITFFSCPEPLTLHTIEE